MEKSYTLQLDKQDSRGKYRRKNVLTTNDFVVFTRHIKDLPAGTHYCTVLSTTKHYIRKEQS